MTYCVGILTTSGLVVAADSRSNAGLDHIATVRKLALFERPGERIMVLLSAGNLATTQAVVTLLNQRLVDKASPHNLHAARTMFDAARMVGAVLREVLEYDGEHVQPHGDPSASFLLAGQLKGGRHRLFLVYAAGNFIEATAETPFLQVGETKYGKPILVRAYDKAMSFAETVKLLMVSFDSTLKSNLSVGLPLDLVFYEKDSFKVGMQRRIAQDDPYYRQVSEGWSDALKMAFKSLPDFVE
jgi:putative proteasome-type protease